MRGLPQFKSAARTFRSSTTNSSLLNSPRHRTRRISRTKSWRRLGNYTGQTSDWRSHSALLEESSDRLLGILGQRLAVPEGRDLEIQVEQFQQRRARLLL